MNQCKVGVSLPMVPTNPTPQRPKPHSGKRALVQPPDPVRFRQVPLLEVVGVLLSVVGLGAGRSGAVPAAVAAVLMAGVHWPQQS